MSRPSLLLDDGDIVTSPTEQLWAVSRKGFVYAVLTTEDEAFAYKTFLDPHVNGLKVNTVEGARFPK